MKRIITILLIVMMVFSITGCDPDGRAKMADFMDKMGQNVMGTDTSRVDNLIQETEVKAEDIKSSGVKPKLDEEGKVVEGVHEVEFAPGIKVEMNDADAEKASTVLPPIKSSTVSNIGNSLKNDESKDKLVKEMKAPVTDANVQKAAQGSATVMKAALNQLTETLPTDQVPPAVQESLKNVSESLQSISDDPTTVSKADVVTLQLVNDFVAITSKPEHIELIKNGEVPQEVLSGANNLFTVTSALSEASRFNPNVLVGAIVSATSGKTEVPDTSATKSLSRAGEPTVVDVVDRVSAIEIPAEAQSFINIAYDAIQDVIGNGDFAQTKSGLGFHKMSYENYANMVAGKIKLEFVNKNDANSTVDVKYNHDSYLDSNEFVTFKSFAGVAQYAVAAAFSEGDDYYQAFLKILETGKYNDVKICEPVDITEFATNIKDFIIDFEKVNGWVAKPTKNKVNVVIPEEYQQLLDLDPEKFAKVAEALMTGRDLDGNVIKGQKQYFRVAMDTINKMLVFTDLSSIAGSIGDTDLNYLLVEAIDKLYVRAYEDAGAKN